MDIAALRQELEAERDGLLQWLAHPITTAIVQDTTEQRNALDRIILDEDVTDLSSLLTFLAAKGHRRGLDRWRSSVDDRLEEIEKTIEELPQDK